ncbi:MAG: 16S rRNA (guanine(966)-N(2))-methyltransferase RsmD [Erysipelotrichaceae bacterium]|nr:16S rRNA (guanine(966)-N(2))-methyltransferase RsmD [Erysipelotrichaceae bacterium]
MRIIAGKYRSRPLKTLKSNHTRPTLDKVKEAVFSKLGAYFAGGKCLDLFSGSGAIGLECLSRGMDEAYMIDNNYDAINIIKANVKALEAQKCHILKMNYQVALSKLQDECFDLIYLDPPYHLTVYDEIIKFIYEHDMLDQDHGYIVCEGLKEVKIQGYEELAIEKSVDYGIMTITYLRYKK